MVTDRCATSSLIVYLGVLYPQYTVFWQILVSLDLSSHYMHMYAMLSVLLHIKMMKLNRNYYHYIIIIDWYYFVCLINELFYMAVYLHYYKFLVRYSHASKYSNLVIQTNC